MHTLCVCVCLVLYFTFCTLGDPATSAITISHMGMFPKPLHIPGEITTAYDITINRRIGQTSHLVFNVTWEKKILNSWHVVRCQNGLGSWLVWNISDSCTKFC